MSKSSVPSYRRPRTQVIAAVLFGIGISIAPLMNMTSNAMAAPAQAPTNLSVTQDGGTVSATWTAPQSYFENNASRHANLHAHSSTPGGYYSPTSYTCTLMYGFSQPSAYSVTSPNTSCSFSNVSTSTVYGIGVVATYNILYDGYYQDTFVSPQVVAFPVATLSSSSSGSTSATTTSTSTTTTWPTQPKTTITCVKGKVTKKVTAVDPRCPAGYKKK